jgi:hypothetical protein
MAKIMRIEVAALPYADGSGHKIEVVGINDGDPRIVLTQHDHDVRFSPAEWPEVCEAITKAVAAIEAEIAKEK